jgi:hypothetical protein
VRPLSGSHSKRSPSSEHYDTSPIAPLSAPIAMFRPTPPMTAKREMSGGMVAGIRLPPVISASPSPLQASPEDIGKALTPPSSLNTAPELERCAFLPLGVRTVMDCVIAWTYRCVTCEYKWAACAENRVAI